MESSLHHELDSFNGFFFLPHWQSKAEFEWVCQDEELI